MEITLNYNDTKIQIFKIFSGIITENVQMHSHTKNGFEIHLIDGGEGILETTDNSYPLEKNSLFITGPNVLHKQITNKNNPMHELCVYFKISNTGHQNSSIKAFTGKSFWIGTGNQIIMQLFKEMIAENERSCIWKKDILSSLAIRLICEITRLYYPQSSNYAEIRNTDLNESRSWILDQLLLEDCSNVTLTDFANNMGVSPRQAERIIKDYYGSSFKKLRYEAKMASAATLLEQNNISIEECAAKCGYNSASAFTTAFKQKYNITPKAYKEQFK